MSRGTIKALGLGSRITQLLVLLSVIAFAYLVQFFIGAANKNQPGALGLALQEAGQLHLARIQHTEPSLQLQLTRVYGGPEQCNWWNFEEIWGRCATAHLEVADRSDLDLGRTHAIATDLLQMLSYPCRRRDNASLRNDPGPKVECGQSYRPFRVTLIVKRVAPGPGGFLNTNDKTRWNSIFIETLLTLRQTGEL
jgi:hypothetical protein